MGNELLTELLELPGCFVKEKVISGQEIILSIERNGYPICPRCGQSYIKAPKDSRLQEVEDLSVFGRRCYLRVCKYRIECSCGYCGTEYLEWLDRYQRFTVRYRKWIYAFCKRMTGIDVSRIFGISKHTVYRLDREGIEEELSTQKPISPERISIDEISRKKGHKYATIISAPDERKILDVVKGRKAIDIMPFFEGKGKKWCKSITAVTMDAWLAFRKVVLKHCTEAVICFDHFHLAQHFSKAIDNLRVAEAKKASKDTKEFYKDTKWLLLKRPERLREDQQTKLDQLLEVNKSLYKAYLLRDEFRQIFKGSSVRSRLIRLTNWKRKAKSARVSQLTEFVKKIESWEPYIRNSLRESCSNSFAEGINTKVRVIQRMAYGYRDFEYLRLKIFQQFNFREIKTLFDG
jgi:transposase